MNLPHHWYVIALSSEVKRQQIKALKRFGEDLVLWRNPQGGVVIMEDRCPHRSAKLSLGEFRDGNLACPFHGLQFDAQGSCQFVPELGRGISKLCVKTYRSVEKDGWIWMWWGAVEPSREVPESFQEVDASFSTAILKERWRTHLTRSIENQLDFAHLPFVHRKTIGKFAGSPRRFPEFLMDDQRIKWFFRKSDGSTPSTFIEYRFPNIWINRITEKYSITVAFVPVDEEFTDLYLQSHQKFLNLPVLAKIVNFLMIQLNRKILIEDRRVVLTQAPMNVRDAETETLLPSDQAIRHVRKWLDSAHSQG